MPVTKIRMKKVLTEIQDYLENRLIPFWTENSIDEKFGGFLTAFDESGRHLEIKDKLIVSQSRMIWAAISYYELYPDEPRYLEMAEQGFRFFSENFWDEEFGGWYWKVSRNGSCIDDGKVMYGQSFALYSIAKFYNVTGDETALEYAVRTFDLIQKFGTDTLNGGYYEFFERDWTICEAGFAGGDRKSVDVHLHLMEAFTELVIARASHIHRRKLEEIIQLILGRMINEQKGCIFNQFNPAFEPIPAIYVKRTWNAERERGSIVRPPADVTAFGNNIELAWLLNRAKIILEKPDGYFADITKKLVDYTYQFGFDHVNGGMYRDGTHDGIVLTYDKDFWQSAEALIGFLDAYEATRLDRYADAFTLTWDFVRQNFINKKTGEWHQLVSREGKAIIPELNIWRSSYHTGRAMMECVGRLKRITGNGR